MYYVALCWRERQRLRRRVNVIQPDTVIRVLIWPGFRDLVEAPVRQSAFPSRILRSSVLYYCFACLRRLLM